jgi:LysM repeat protein
MARGRWGIVAGLMLALALLRIQPAFAQEPVRYTVQPGDTLTRIAARFGTTVEALAEANHLVNPNLIYVGQVLLIPASTASPSPSGRVHAVQPGETLYRIALRYGTTVERLMALNGLRNPHRIFVGQLLRIPEEAPGTPAAWPAPFQDIRLGPAPAVQGRVFPVRVRLSQPATLEARFLGIAFPLAPTPEGGEGLIAVPAMQAPGVYSLGVTARTPDGRTVQVSLPVQVVAGPYGREAIRLPPDRQGLLDPELLRVEREKVLAACTPFEPERRWQGPFRYPVARPEVTSEFGTRRSYNGGPYSSYHEGAGPARERWNAGLCPGRRPGGPGGGVGGAGQRGDPAPRMGYMQRLLASPGRSGAGGSDGEGRGSPGLCGEHRPLHRGPPPLGDPGAGDPG